MRDRLLLKLPMAPVSIMIICSSLSLSLQLVLEESLNGLSAVRRKVERILDDVDRRRALLAPSSSSSSSSSPPLAPTEAFFLTNVRDSVPDVLKFTREQFAAVAAAL